VSPLRILNLNVWNTDGPWPERSRRIGEWIDRLDPDLLGFQEVARMDGCDQLAELLDGRDYHRDYVVASPFWKPGREEEKGEVGNAVASRWPITDREELQLPGLGDFETRSALSVDVAAPFGPLSFTVTHLNWRLDHGFVRERQVRAVCELARRRAPRRGFPPLLVGDFNAEPESTEIRHVTGLHALEGQSVCFLDAWARAGDGSPGFTWSNRNDWARKEREPDRRIDYVFAGLPRRDGLGQLLACRVVCDDAIDGVWPSDHFGVYAELRSEALAG